MDQSMKHDKMHWRCCWMPMLGIILWVLSAVSVILAWVAIWKQALVLGYEPIAWYWNALVLGVLAIPMKSHGGWCKSHGDSCGGGTCGIPEGKI